MQVTISLLPASLSLVHIPRSRITQLSHPILKQILLPNPTFLNITCNEVELSLFADETLLEDFEPIARKDRRRKRSRSNAGPSRKTQEVDPVEISCERWSVLQVDSHSDQIDNSGARVNEVSAPLAAAGISILYQSSYMSDFIFVKETRLSEAMDLLATAGFEIYSSDTDSPISPARPPGDKSLTHDFRPSKIFNPESNLTRTRNGTDPALLNDNSQAMNNLRGLTSMMRSVEVSPRNKSYSPTSGEVCLLPSDLACVGLSDEFGVDHWGLKIVKLVAFPELITLPSISQPSPVCAIPTPQFFRKPSTPLFELSPPPVDHPRRSSSSAGSCSSSSSGDGDGYFSHSPETKSSAPHITSGSRTHSDIKRISVFESPYKLRSKHAIQPVSLLSTNFQTPTTDQSPRHVDATPSGSRVPFFSYTRTSEGSSLTADVYVLSTLFPAHERHMVICSGELDAADSRLINGVDAADDSSDDDDDSENGDFSQGSILICLQIDLQRFGLDKHGLVNRFSRVLEANGINHMYSSTFKTANLLVDKKQAHRAQSLLCLC